MLRSAASKVMRVGRATVFLVGLAVILALVFGVLSRATAHDGSAGLFHLGHNNLTSALSTLTGNVNGSALRVVNNNAGADDTALDLSVQSGEAPMKVNSKKVVTNLNADSLDGKDSGAFGFQACSNLSTFRHSEVAVCPGSGPYANAAQSLSKSSSSTWCSPAAKTISPFSSNSSLPASTSISPSPGTVTWYLSPTDVISSSLGRSTTALLASVSAKPSPVSEL